MRKKEELQMAIAGFGADILICFGVPLAGLLLCRKHKCGSLRAGAAGILCFIISQIVVRIPLLTLILPQFAWFHLMQLNPWIYGIFLGLTAGLAEEGARWIFMKCFLSGKGRKRIGKSPDVTGLEFLDGLAFGLGHGGIEAVLFVGVNAAVTLALILAGAYPAELVSASDVWLGGMERIFAMSFHIGASLLIMYGVRVKKAFRYFLLALTLHTALDAAIVILPGVFSVGTIGMEIWCAVFGTGTLLTGLFVYLKGNRVSGLVHHKMQRKY